MIWDDPKYARVVMALEPIRWHKPDDEGYRYELECSPIDGWGITEGFHPVEVPDDDSRVTSDFVTGCIIAEFAVRWLWNKHLVAVMPALSRDGFVWRIAERDNNRWEYMPGGYTDRHEALAEGMLAFLREEAGL